MVGSVWETEKYTMVKLWVNLKTDTETFNFSASLRYNCRTVFSKGKSGCQVLSDIKLSDILD